MVAVLVNWISTISIFILTCEKVVLQRYNIESGTDLLAVCFTALFALPSVRSLLPGAPDFGAIIGPYAVKNASIICLTEIMCRPCWYYSQRHHYFPLHHDNCPFPSKRFERVDKKTGVTRFKVIVSMVNSLLWRYALISLLWMMINAALGSLFSLMSYINDFA